MVPGHAMHKQLKKYATEGSLSLVIRPGIYKYIFKYLVMMHVDFFSFVKNFSPKKKKK